MAQQRHQFSIHVEAAPERVWEILWNKENYPKWTEPFSPGGRFETDWKKGGKVIFTDEKGQGGLVSRIEEIDPPRFLSFEHRGFLKDGKEDYESEEVKKWIGAKENYTLKPTGTGTEVLIDIDLEDGMKDYFMKAWPLALDKIKELSEAPQS